MVLRDRLRALERRAAGSDLLVVLVSGGLPDDEREPKTAGAGEYRWTQDPGESDAVFQTRVVVEARVAAGAGGYVWIGGLPDN